MDINWTLLRQLARADQLPIGEGTVDKIKAGKLRFTEDVSIAIHRVTEGGIPCWATRPDLWSEGQVPPVLAA